jgi:hypothetical protein
VPLLHTAVDPGGTMIVVFLAGGGGLLLLMHPAKTINIGIITKILCNFTPPIFSANLPPHIREGTTRLGSASRFPSRRLPETCERRTATWTASAGVAQKPSRRRCLAIVSVRSNVLNTKRPASLTSPGPRASVAVVGRTPWPASRRSTARPWRPKSP